MVHCSFPELNLRQGESVFFTNLMRTLQTKSGKMTDKTILPIHHGLVYPLMMQMCEIYRSRKMN